MTEYHNKPVAVNDALLAQIRWEARRRGFISSSCVLGLIDRLDYAEAKAAVYEGKPVRENTETQPSD